MRFLAGVKSRLTKWKQKEKYKAPLPGYIIEKLKEVRKIRNKYYPGQLDPAVNGRVLISYDRKRQPFTLTVYSDHIRRFTVYYDYRKQ